MRCEAYAATYSRQLPHSTFDWVMRFQFENAFHKLSVLMPHLVRLTAPLPQIKYLFHAFCSIGNGCFTIWSRLHLCVLKHIFEQPHKNFSSICLSVCLPVWLKFATTTYFNTNVVFILLKATLE